MFYSWTCVTIWAMNDTFLYHAFGVRKGYEYVNTKYVEGSIIFTLAVKEEMLLCPQCGSNDVVRKGKRYRKIKTLPIGLREVFLNTEVPKCECKNCVKTFEVSPPLPRHTSITLGNSKTLCLD